jgi:hypothetical protein
MSLLSAVFNSRLRNRTGVRSASSFDASLLFSTRSTCGGMLRMRLRIWNCCRCPNRATVMCLLLHCVDGVLHDGRPCRCIRRKSLCTVQGGSKPCRRGSLTSLRALRDRRVAAGAVVDDAQEVRRQLANFLYGSQALSRLPLDQTSHDRICGNENH